MQGVCNNSTYDYKGGLLGRKVSQQARVWVSKLSLQQKISIFFKFLSVL